MAIADLETRFARPLEVVDARETDPVARVIELARDHTVPSGSSSGNRWVCRAARGRRSSPTEGSSNACETAGIDVAEHDERLTTVIAEQGLRAGGAAPKARKEIRDAVAAQVLLQSYLDGER